MKKLLVQTISFFIIVVALGYVVNCQEVQYNVTIYKAQQKLDDLGYDPGVIDGILGQKTRNAIEIFQQFVQLPITGELDKETIKKLGIPHGKVEIFSLWGVSTNNSGIKGIIDSTNFNKSLKSRLQKNALGTKNESTEPIVLHETLREFFAQYYLEKKVTIQVTQCDERFVNFYAKHLKNEVIKGENYWENIQVSVSIFDHEDSLTILCIIDGKFTAGLGSPPPDKNFIDMEPEYTKFLQDYAGELLVKLRDYAVKGEF